MKNYEFNKEFQEIYSDFKINKTAKKRGGKKDITLDLQEESKKKYSQYIGYIKNKMKGGADYNWNLLTNFFKNDCKYTGENQQVFKFQYKILSLGGNTKINVVIFGTELISIDGNNYLPYIYFLYSKYKDVRFKKVLYQNGNINFTDISYDDLSKISVKIKNQYNINRDYSIITLLYTELIKGSSQYSTEKPTEQIELKDKFIQTSQLIPHQSQQLFQQNPKLMQPQSQQLFQQNPQLMQPQSQQLLQQQIFNKNTQTNQYYYYRCEDPSMEVLVKNDGNIFFGYDENLLVMPPNISKNNQQIQDTNKKFKFYYKYSLQNEKFFELKKENGKLSSTEIELKKIPIYDILCLYYAIKGLETRKKLETILLERIDTAKENISTTGEAFFKLDNTNFNKQKRDKVINKLPENEAKITSSLFKNFGKVKKRRITGKTYIFFGTKYPRNSSRNKDNSFSFVCFREDNKVYFIKKGEFNTEIPLNNFTNIGALEDLISFILLRRMISDNEKDFAEIILKEAESRIKILKKMAITAHPYNYKNTGNNLTFKQLNLITTERSNNNTGNGLRPIPLNLITILPISPNPIVAI